MNTSIRIKSAREHAGLDQSGLGKAVGVTQQAVQKWEKKGLSSIVRLTKIATACDVSIAWLSTGEGEMPPSSEKPAIIISSQGNPTNGDEVTIPQYHDHGGAMGNGVLLRDQPGQITKWSVSQEWATKNIPANTGIDHICVVTGFGDSMKGLFNSGDPLIVDTAVKTVEFDSVYFFRVKDEGFIKRLQRIPGEGLRVLSENKSYDPWAITPDMDFEVFGRVLKVWKSEEF